MKQNKGFTLIEVMLSVSILAIGVLLVLSSFTRSLGAIGFSEDLFKAGLILQEKFYDICNSDREKVFPCGELPDFGKRFSWDVHITDTEKEGPDEVALKISWNRKNNSQHDFSVVTYLR